MTNRIKYDFASLGDLSSSLQAEFSHLEELANKLKQQVSSLDGSWHSPLAKSAYSDAQLNWDRVFSQSREQLLGIHHGVTNASRTMSDLDGAIGRGFRGMA
ncbi:MULTISPECIES: WXG100 family type VII secretion target [unclassified Gordonia (in: high G+C Gram-positive bacteria)]